MTFKAVEMQSHDIIFIFFVFFVSTSLCLDSFQTKFYFLLSNVFSGRNSVHSDYDVILILVFYLMEKWNKCKFKVLKIFFKDFWQIFHVNKQSFNLFKACCQAL